MKAKNIKANIIIHSFAIAHGITVIALKHMGIADDIPLTLLTIAMIIMVAKLYEFPLDITAAIALLCCMSGFYLGTKGASIIGQSTVKIIASNANLITTLLVTEILGWITYFIVRRRGLKAPEQKGIN